MSTTPTKCNKCNSANIKHQVWGRTEYYVCTDCLQEVVPQTQEAFVGYDAQYYWGDLGDPGLILPTTVWGKK